ncbi:hypothetical protein BGW80DRAFT_70282 [Lactifluus volemus]|nr:hypothetical protein BGW80DRAFT_70282 [Lactifluus volemus]
MLLQCRFQLAFLLLWLPPVSSALDRLSQCVPGPYNSVELTGTRLVANGCYFTFWISYHHCEIIWDGREDRFVSVVRLVHGHSSNGT